MQVILTYCGFFLEIKICEVLFKKNWTIIYKLHYVGGNLLLHTIYSRRIFLSNQIVHKILFSLCFWAQDPLMDKFTKIYQILGLEPKIKPK